MFDEERVNKFAISPVAYHLKPDELVYWISAMKKVTTAFPNLPKNGENNGPKIFILIPILIYLPKEGRLLI